MARLGGDEFALMLRDVAESLCPELLEGLREDLARPLEVNGRTVAPRVHLGWALFPRDADRPEELLRLAHAGLTRDQTQAPEATATDPAPSTPTPEPRAGSSEPAESGLRLLHPRLAQRALEHASEGFVCLHRDGRHLYVNDAVCQLLGYEREDLLSRRVWEVLPDWSPEDWAQHWEELRGLGTMRVESAITRKDGERRRIEATPWLIVLDGEEYNCAFIHDITEHRSLEQALRLERERLAETLECITDAFYTLDRQWRFTYLNREARRLLHAEAERPPEGGENLTGRVIWEAFPGVLDTAIEHEYRRAMYDGVPVHFELHYRPLATRFEIHAYPTEEGLAVFFRDVTERHRAEQEIEFLALYDPLTGLANRKLLTDRLQQALAEGARTGGAGAVVLLDLDHFRGINDTLGHEHGDQLLQQVAARLKECLRENDTVARFGGDEFVIVAGGLNGAEAPQQARQLAAKVFDTLRAHYTFGGVDYYATPSLGASLYGVPGAASTPQELLKRADLAMHEAKEAGGNTLRLFDPSMESSANERVQLEREIREGVPRNEFVPYYQPRVDHTGRVLGAEALARWQHPRRGLLTPGAFMPVAEDSELILDIGASILRQSCAQLARWTERPATAPIEIGVNVSARQFHHPAFLEGIERALLDTGADPQGLVLEVTETMLLTNLDDTIAKMEELKRWGVRFALDDFGTGYSSLYYLKRLPLDELKIDQSFVRDALEDASDATIVRTIIALAHALELRVVAEGVETEATRQYLQEHGCPQYQGFLFSAALPAEAFQQLLDEGAG